MAKYINPVATGLAIGQGEAQVFDTSGVWKVKMDAQKEAKKEKERKEKELLNSLVEMDTSKLWDRDLGMYNEQWNSYREFIKENFNALQNPSKNPDIWMEKKKREQTMLQFSNSSAEAKKVHFEVQKEMAKNSNLRDRYGLYAKQSETPGDFSNSWEHIDTKPDELGALLEGYMSTAIKAYDKDSVIERKDPTTGDLIKTTVKGSSPEKWQEMYSTQYETNNMWQRSAEEAWEAAGGAEKSGFATPKEYVINEAMKYRPQEKYGKDITQEGDGSDFNWTFGAGGSTFDKTQFSKKDIIGKTTDYEGDDRVVVRNRVGSQMKNLPYMEMNLQGAVRDSDGQNVDLTGGTIKVAIEDLVRKTNTDGTSSYQVRLRKPISREDEKNKEAKLEEINDNIEEKKLKVAELKDSLIFKEKNKQKLLNKEIVELEKQKRLLEKGYEILTVPLDNETNIAQVETAIGVQDLFNQLPQIFGEPDASKKGQAKELD